MDKQLREQQKYCNTQSEIPNLRRSEKKKRFPFSPGTLNL